MLSKFCQHCNTSVNLDNLDHWYFLFYKKRNQKIVRCRPHYKQTRLAYRLKFKEKERHSHTLYLQKRKQNDPSFKLGCLLRSRMSTIIKAKTFTTFEYLGCTLQELKAYIEDKFIPTMTWGNHGVYWHLDHILPLGCFNLSDWKQYAIASHYTNLQPLTIQENYSKNIIYRSRKMAEMEDMIKDPKPKETADASK